MPDGSAKAIMPDGSNPKRMLGRAAGAAIKLSADADVTMGLGIAEGIETALSILSAGWRPVWREGRPAASPASRCSPASRRSRSSAITTRTEPA